MCQVSTTQYKELYLCLLDDVALDSDVDLGEFRIRYYKPDELSGLLRGTEDKTPSPSEQARFRLYAKFPWALLERSCAHNGSMDQLTRVLIGANLSYRHAGEQNWWPFDRLIRTLHLMKASPGPVMPRQFYSWTDPPIQKRTQIGRVIYGEPEACTDGPESEDRPYLWEYRLGKEDTERYNEVDRKLRACLECSHLDVANAYLLTAIHYFERGDRQLTPLANLDAFAAVDPLMSYDASLEALLIGETERGIADKLAGRMTALLNDRPEGIGGFMRRVFWLRSKVAHGVRHPREIADLIVGKPDAAIPGEQGEAGMAGPYSHLFLEAHVFPGFLMNLRECAQRAISFFCDEYVKGRDRDQTLEKLGS